MNGDRSAVEVLNALLAAEAGSLMPHLAETGLFAHPASADELAALQRLASDSLKIQQWLSETIVSLRGTPAPRFADSSIADTHYVSVESLLPRVTEACRRLVETYRDAASRVADSPPAAEVVNRISTRHLKNLEALQALATKEPSH